jgi:uncharacterized membrane protein
LFDVAIAVSFALATINSLKGLPKKRYIIIAVGCGVLSEFMPLISYINSISDRINDGIYLYLFTSPLCIIGRVALYIALLFFCLNNEMSAVSIKVKREKNTEKMTPEQLLKYLKKQLDLGTITEEEYQAQRADIISKL